MEQISKTVAIKNEDLEARSRRNNVRIAGLAEDQHGAAGTLYRGLT